MRKYFIIPGNFANTADRARYRRICNMTRGTDYADDCAMENAVCGELYRRGF